MGAHYTNLQLPPSGGTNRGPASNKMCTDIWAHDFCGPTSKTLSLKSKTPKSAATWGPPRCGPRSRRLAPGVWGTWVERVEGKVCLPCCAGTKVAWAVAAEEAGGGWWHLSPCLFPMAARKRWAPGKLRHFRWAASCALGGRPGQPFQEKTPAQVLRLSPRAVPDPIWAKCNS